MQPSQDGLAQAFLLGADPVAGNTSYLIPGDNIFCRTGMGIRLQHHQDLTGAAIFGYRVADPKAYGVVELDDGGRAVSLEEKPAEPRSGYAMPGALLLGRAGGRLRP